MALTQNQILAFLAIQRALAQATDSGLFEEMCAHAHPDALNTFCDDVASFAARELNMTHIEGFNIRVVEQGQAYGPNDSLINDRDEPLVEFYDSRQSDPKFGLYGQFVGRYYRSTILGNKFPQGFGLDTGKPWWFVTAIGMQAVRTFLDRHMMRIV